MHPLGFVQGRLGRALREIYPKHSVITVEAEDFGVYRRNKREIIPLISLPCG